MLLFVLFFRGVGGSRGVSRRQGRWGHSGHRSSFELQINQGLFPSSSHLVQGHPDYTRLKCVCVCVFECVSMQRDLEGGGGLLLVGLAYNSDRARELKAVRYDGQANGPCSPLYLNRHPKIRENREAARRIFLALRIRGGVEGGGNVVLRQTASEVDRAPIGCFSMGSGKNTQPFWLPMGPSLW